MKRTLLLLPVLLLAGCGDSQPEAKAPTAAPAVSTAAPPAASAAPVPSVAPAGPQPPIARKEPHTTTMAGHVLTDDYFWMRQKGSPDVVAYLEAENAYTEKMTAAEQPLVQKLYDETVSRLEETDVSVPFPMGGWLYYSRTEKGKQYPIRCRKRAKGDATEVVILDANEIAKTEKFVGIGDWAVSDDANLFAYMLDTTGFRQYTMHIKELRTGKELAETIPRVDGLAFTADGSQIFYVTEDEQTKRANQLHAHILGTDVAKDRLVYDEKDERFSLSAERSRSRDFIVVESESKITSDVRLVDARHPNAPPVLVEPRVDNRQYSVEPGKSALFIRTNDQGKNFRLVTAPFKTPDSAHWKEVVPYRPDVMLEEVHAFSDHLVLRERKDANVTFRSLDTKGASRVIAIDSPVYEMGNAANAEFGATTFRFAFAAPITPWTIYEENLRTGERVLLKRYNVPGFDPAKYDSARIHVKARDGAMVPVSLIYAKGTTPDGTHPMFLNAYGSYGISYDVGWDSGQLSLLDRGVVIAVAHIRGGGELGKAWHEAGRMEKKMNTFTDFIDSAEGLVQTGWAKPGSIAIYGASAGGLLMGAVTNLRPDLFRAVIAGVPFVDVLNSMYDETLPETVEEFEEWGNPKIPEQYGWMAAYSPYDNVAKKDYPTLLIESSYNDSQVMYWEPAKWAAKLRAMKTDKNPLYLKVNMKPAGHGGGSGRYEQIRERAFDYAFVLHELGADGNVAH